MSVSEVLFRGLRHGERACLAKAITLVESQASRHQQEAAKLMQAVTKYSGKSIRVGLSGPPGVGKSTLIEALGMHIVSLEKKVAVLAVDPSSPITGGSILGDKTRMPNLSQHPSAYIRPSPSQGTLGGVARTTNESILICEAGGYDVVLVETVGVGQSEVAVANMVDVFVFIVPPAGGDELQGLKKGIMEMVDIILVNKADGDLLPAARRAQMEYTSALKLLHPKTFSWIPKVLPISSIENTGIDKAWSEIEKCYQTLKASGELEKNRSEQRKRWMWKIISEGLMTRLREDPEIIALLDEISPQVTAGILSAGRAADEVLQLLNRKPLKNS